MIFGSIKITQPDGRQRDLPLNGTRLHIGSALDNDLVITGLGVAPYHAVITCDENSCQIVDVGSAGGTLLDDQPMLLNTPHDLEPGIIIRIGGWSLTYCSPSADAVGQALESAPRPVIAPTDLLRDLLAEDLGPAIAVAPPPVAAPAAPAAQPWPPAGYIDPNAPMVVTPLVSRKAVAPEVPSVLLLSLSESQLRVAPGESARVTITIANRGELVDSVALALEGVPPGGYTFAPPEINVFPGAKEQIELLFHPPLSHIARAGFYPFRVIARSQQGGPAVGEGVLEVTAMYKYSLSLAPQVRTAIGRASYQLTIANESNAELPLTLLGEDPEERLRFNFVRSQVVVPPGTDLVMPMRASLGLRKMAGQDKTYTFTIRSTPSFDANLFQTTTGQLVHHPLLPPALTRLLLMMMAGLMACAALSFSLAAFRCSSINANSVAGRQVFLAQFFPFCQDIAHAQEAQATTVAATTQIQTETINVQTSGPATQAAMDAAAQATALGVAQTQTAITGFNLATQTAAVEQAGQTQTALAGQFAATNQAQTATAQVLAQTQTAVIVNSDATQSSATETSRQTTTAQALASAQTQTAAVLAMTATEAARPTATPTATPTPTQTSTPTTTPTVTPIPVKKLVFQPGPGTTMAGSAFTAQLVVRAQDDAGNLAESFNGSVTLRIKDGTGTSGALLKGSVTVRAVNGRATFSGLSIDKVGANYRLVATAGAVTGDSDAFNITASRLSFSGIPTGGTRAGAAFAASVTVRAEDSFGNVDRTFNQAVKLDIEGGTGTTGAALSNGSNGNAVNGEATFSGLSIDKLGTDYRLIASGGGLTGESAAFTITANQLVFVVSPGASAVGTPFSVQPMIIATDGKNNIDSTFNGPITLTLKGGTPGATLGGTTTVNMANGTADFKNNGLQINQAGVNYVLSTTINGLTGESAPFNVT